MKFEMTNNIAFETKHRKNAEEFYEKVMGMKIAKKESEYTEFSSGDTKFYVANQNKSPGLMLDFVVDNQEAAMSYLKENGCEVIEWKGKGQDCFMKDPFGLVFNIWGRVHLK
jgi:catechol 2,3-dioxygenase-like lactoylglutathione lyase family enzyme